MVEKSARWEGKCVQHQKATKINLKCTPKTSRGQQKTTRKIKYKQNIIEKKQSANLNKPKTNRKEKIKLQK